MRVVLIEGDVQRVLELVGIFAFAVSGALVGRAARRRRARDPILVRPDTELYAVPAITGALTLAFAISRWGHSPFLGVSVACGIIVFRLAALTCGWRAPRAWRHAGPAE